MSLKCHIYATYINSFLCTWDILSLYISYEINAINNVTRSTGIHTFPITGICPWTNMPATWHRYISLYLCCSLPIDFTYAANIHQKSIPLQAWSMGRPYSCKICASNKYTLKCHQYTTCPNNLICMYRGSMPIYMPHIKLLPSMM